MKKWVVISVWMLAGLAGGRAQNTLNDGDWSKNYAFMKNTAEAEYMIRVGDVDNLNFGWPKDFNPFCGTPTPRHAFPWTPKPEDLPGMDRIMLGDSYKCKTGGDGYSGSCSEQTKAVPVSIPLHDIKGVAINAVKMQVFIDDFQSPSRHSNFTITVNGKRFVEMEKLIRSIDQTGPIGKLITVDVNAELLKEFTKDSVTFLVNDYLSKAGDGFAIDFIKLLINPKQEIIYKGTLKGTVTDNKGVLLDSVKISVTGLPEVTTDAKGTFQFADIQTGLRVIEAYKKGYSVAYKNVDVMCTKTTEVKIVLGPSKKIMFNGQNITEGESLTLSKIQFAAGKADLSAAAKTELDKIFTFLNANRGVDVELNGFTSSEGEVAYNKELSLKRVESCKQYLVGKGIDEKRIFTEGWGPERPVAPNDTEANRAKNRRVEMRIARIR